MAKFYKVLALTFLVTSGLVLFTACTTPAADVQATQPTAWSAGEEQTSATPTETTESLLPTPTHTPTPEPVPESVLGVTPEDLNGITIQFWHPWSGVQSETIADLVQAFNETNEWGIGVEITSFDDLDQLWAEVHEASQTGEMPDLAVGAMHQILSMDTPDQAIDLVPYLNDPVWGLSPEDQADFFPSILKSIQMSDNFTGFPAQQFGHVLFYNKTWAQELGFDAAPQTPDEVFTQACAAANANLLDDDAENDGSGGTIISNSIYIHSGMAKRLRLTCDRQ